MQPMRKKHGERLAHIARTKTFLNLFDIRKHLVHHWSSGFKQKGEK